MTATPTTGQRCIHTTGPPLLPDSYTVSGACGYRVDRDLNTAVNLAVWAEQHHAQTRDLDARGLITNAPRGDGSDPHHRAGETSPDDGRIRPPHPPRVPVAGTPEKGGESRTPQGL
jgi:putative transposase